MSEGLEMDPSADEPEHVLSPEEEAVIEGDRRFFARHTERRHRLRLAGRAEAALASRTSGEPFSGDAWFAVVRQIIPGVRVKLFFTGPAGNDTDVGEAECRWLYERARAGNLLTKKIEQSLATVLPSKARE